MTDNQNQHLTRIEEKLDRNAAGAVAVSFEAGGTRFASMLEVMEFSKLMSLAGVAAAKHCRGQPGVCLAVTLQAIEWKMSPFAVASKSYVVNDVLSYESQLVHAVIESRAPLKSRLRCRYAGEGIERTCTVYGTFRDESEPHEYTTPKIRDIKVKNSPLWVSDPDQQLWYYGSRAWARKWCPEILLGIYTPEEVETIATEIAVAPQAKLIERLDALAGTAVGAERTEADAPQTKRHRRTKAEMEADRLAAIKAIEEQAKERSAEAEKRKLDAAKAENAQQVEFEETKPKIDERIDEKTGMPAFLLRNKPKQDDQVAALMAELQPLVAASGDMTTLADLWNDKIMPVISKLAEDQYAMIVAMFEGRQKQFEDEEWSEDEGGDNAEREAIRSK